MVCSVTQSIDKQSVIVAQVQSTDLCKCYHDYGGIDMFCTARKVPVSKSSQGWKLYDFKECTSLKMYKRAQGLKPFAL